MSFKWTGTAVIAALAITSLAVACGDDDDNPVDDPTEDSTLDTTLGTTMDSEHMTTTVP